MIQENEKESYWNIMSSYKKMIALKYFAIIKEKPEHEWNNYIETAEFINKDIDPFSLPDWIHKAKPHQLYAMADSYVSPETKRLIQMLKEAGKL